MSENRRSVDRWFPRDALTYVGRRQINAIRTRDRVFFAYGNARASA